MRPLSSGDTAQDVPRANYMPPYNISAHVVVTVMFSGRYRSYLHFTAGGRRTKDGAILSQVSIVAQLANSKIGQFFFQLSHLQVSSS